VVLGVEAGGDFCPGEGCGDGGIGAGPGGGGQDGAGGFVVAQVIDEDFVFAFLFAHVGGVLIGVSGFQVLGDGFCESCDFVPGCGGGEGSEDVESFAAGGHSVRDEAAFFQDVFQGFGR